MEMAKIIYLSELRTEATHIKSGKTIITDAPVDNNGKGSAFSPTDLLSTSLGCCMLTLIGIRSEKNNFDPGKISAKVYKTMGINPRRVTALKIELFFEKTFAEDQRKIVEDAALNCPVAKSIHPDINQDISFSYGVTGN